MTLALESGNGSPFNQHWTVTEQETSFLRYVTDIWGYFSQGLNYTD